ncbi:MAG: M14 family zinc carboxypeptidase [Chloroflexota bacterium]|nr:M14 family zinc carboxypeptidase [Chloroflexota bacterium]
MKANLRYAVALLFAITAAGLATFPLLSAYAEGDEPPADILPSLEGRGRGKVEPRQFGRNVPKLPAGPWVVRAYYTDRQMVNDLAAWREPWQVHHDRGYLVVDVNQTEYDLLLDAGFRLEIDEKLTAQLNQPRVQSPGQTSGIPGYPCYRTVEETFATAQGIAAAHPTLATWTDIGDSWEKTQNPIRGYDMMVLRLTNSAIPGPKPRLFVMTSVHAREYTPAELSTRFAEYLVDNYDADPDVTWLLDYHEIHLMLQANPDGRKKAETGLMWRKNTNESYCSPTSNYRGADLNRNFEFQWGCCGGSSPNECSETYRGPVAASEPETQVIQNYVRAQFPDQRQDDLGAAAPITATGLFVDIHSYSELVLWPWGFTSDPAPNGTALQTLGRKFAYFNDYRPEQAMSLYPTDGTTDSFAYGELGLAAYAFELGTSFFQDCGTFENTILPDNLSALLYAAKVVRTPYLTPAGPDALAVTLAPKGVLPGETVSLTAILDDTRYNNENGTEPTQNIAAAEYTIDVPPWVTTTTPISYAMAAADGAFDETLEEVEATVDTTGLSPGRHILFIRGQDSASNWGALSAAWLYVLGPDSPTIEGTVRQAGTGIPLSGTVETEDGFRTTTDPDTGLYSLRVISGEHALSAIASAHATSTAHVTIQGTQTVQQDFTLYPLCAVFTDDVESGNVGWTAQPPWAITTESYHTPSHSWTDSPGGDYGNNRNTSLTSPVLDLSKVTSVRLSFWHTYDLEAGYDYGYVEYSTDGGSNWTPVASYDGYDHTTWTQQVLALPMLDGQANARLRFRLNSDGWSTADGWHIDDVTLQGGGPVCLPDTIPQISLASSSPDWLGQTTVFTDTTSGTPPITYTWDFGDLSYLEYLEGKETEGRTITHTYATPGYYTVVLTATNPISQATASTDVEVYAADVALEPVTATLAGNPGAPVSYTLRITNTSAYTDSYGISVTGYTWATMVTPTSALDLGPNGSASAIVQVTIAPATLAGEQDGVTVRATSLGDGLTSASATLTTTAKMTCGVLLTPETAALDSIPGNTVAYTLQIRNSGNVTATYTLSRLGSGWPTSLFPSDPFTLGIGGWQSAEIQVTIPATATIGEQDLATVQVTGVGTGIGMESADTSTLTTTVGPYPVYLPLVKRDI